MNPREVTNKLPELISEQVTEHKINIEKNQFYFYTWAKNQLKSDLPHHPHLQYNQKNTLLGLYHKSTRLNFH